MQSNTTEWQDSISAKMGIPKSEGNKKKEKKCIGDLQAGSFEGKGERGGYEKPVCGIDGGDKSGKKRIQCNM